LEEAALGIGIVLLLAVNYLLRPDVCRSNAFAARMKNVDLLGPAAG
jgi:hypothetical protein